MHSACSRRERAGEAAPAQAQHEVDVLPIGEEALVEAALAEKRGAVEAGGGARRADRVSDIAIEQRDRLTV